MGFSIMGGKKREKKKKEHFVTSSHECLDPSFSVWFINLPSINTSLRYFKTLNINKIKRNSLDLRTWMDREIIEFIAEYDVSLANK